MTIKLVASTGRPLSTIEANHVGSASDPMGNWGDLSAWAAPDGTVKLCWNALNSAPEDGVWLTIDAATAVRLALKLGEASAGILADLSRQLGEDRHD